MESDWANPCGGRRWRELPSGEYEVEGEGVPFFAPGTNRFRYVEQTLENWRGEFHRASREYDVPMQWLVGIAAVETGPWSDDPGEQETIRSHAGAIGVMQIMPSTATNVLDRTVEAMFNADDNIDAGADLIARLHRRIRSGLPAICGAYNSGKVCCTDPRCTVGCENEFQVCTDGNYPRAAIMYSNTAVRYLDLSAPLLGARTLGYGLLLTGFAFGAAALMKRKGMLR